MRNRRNRWDVDALVDGVLAGSRAQIARAITLVESSRPEHRLLARDLLNRLRPHTGGAVRLGISGVPGAGKSTFIDAIGTRLIDRGHRGRCWRSTRPRRRPAVDPGRPDPDGRTFHRDRRS